MSVFYDRSKRRWICKYIDTDGSWRNKTCPKTITGKRLAEHWEAAFLADRRAKGIEPPKLGQEPTIATLADEWIRLRRGNPDLAKGTVDDNKNHLDNWVLMCWGKRTVSSLTVPEIREWVRNVRSKVKPTTCRNIHSSFSAMIRDAMVEEWIHIASNPASHPGVLAELPKRRRTDPIFILLSWAVSLLSNRNIEQMRRNRYAFALTTGLREGEIAGLIWEDVHLDADPPYVEVRRSWRLDTRKVGRLKSDDSHRTVPLHPVAVAALKNQRELQLACGIKGSVISKAATFGSMTGQATRHDHVARVLRYDLASCGLPTKVGDLNITFHATRRSFATWLADADVAERDIAYLLGHAAKGVAARHYTASTMERLYAAVCRIQLSPTSFETSSGPVHGP